MAEHWHIDELDKYMKQHNMQHRGLSDAEKRKFTSGRELDFHYFVRGVEKAVGKSITHITTTDLAMVLKTFPSLVDERKFPSQLRAAGCTVRPVDAYRMVTAQA